MSKIVSLNDVLEELEKNKERNTPKKKYKTTSHDESANFKRPIDNDDKKISNKKSSKLGFKKSDNYTRCKNSAIYSLAMREHSRKEIRNKLAVKKYVEGVDIDKLLNELEDKNYLNEERFVESFIRYRSGRGQGIIKISNELRQRGINASMISYALQEADLDWLQLAKEQREKKFGLQIPDDFKEKARQMRFLSGRGFDSECIRHSLRKT